MPSRASVSSGWSRNTNSCITPLLEANVAGTDATLAGRTVLAIFAHPDDESLACGGTLARLADAGARVVLICASSGGRGSISDPTLVPDDNLGRVRTNELLEAATILGIKEVSVLDH